VRRERPRGWTIGERASLREGCLQSVSIGADEWHYPDISVTIVLERGGNTANQEAE
jgi:hypothetical protein